MLSEETKSILEEIKEQLGEGNTTLFLGAGASCASGGPSGHALTEMIQKQFNKSKYTTDDLIQVCQTVLDNPCYNRDSLEQFVRTKIRGLQPTKAHEIMTKYKWSGIFTTNYDDLIEHSYRTFSPQQDTIVISSDKFSISPMSRNKIHIFKLMGCATAPTSEVPGSYESGMVLSRQDYNRMLRRRVEYLRILADYIRHGRIIFIGYSFNDLIVLDVIDELIDLIGRERLPRSYALFDQIKLDDETQYRFVPRKIKPIECDFGSFFDYLSENITPESSIESTVFEHLKIGDRQIRIPKKEIDRHEDSFEILTEEKISEEAGNKDDFFRGINKSWGAFANQWDFKRSIYISHEGNSFKDRVFREIKKTDEGSNKIFLVTGMAGVGKTTLLRRLAYDAYKEASTPVFWISSSSRTFDHRALAGFMEELNNKLEEISSPKTATQKGIQSLGISPLIIVDNAGRFMLQILNLKNYLTSRGRKFTIIAAERRNEWIDGMILSVTPENKIEIEENLCDSEKNSIVEHFHDLGYIPIKSPVWLDRISKDFRDSFFATVYSLVDPAKEPLSEIIKNQYTRLQSDSKKAFSYICCFHQYDISMNLELLLRVMNCDYKQFYNETLQRDAAKVIFEERDGMGNVLFRTHHRIIAEKTIKYFISDPEEQKKLFLEVLGNIVLTNQKEREIVETLLINHIGPSNKNSIFSKLQMRELFETVCRQYPVRSLVHHWGIIESDEQNYIEAEKLFNQAMELQCNSTFAREESDQNILTSLGSMHYHWAIAEKNANNEFEANKHFDMAEQCFQEAKHGEFPNSYAYHSHANLWFRRGVEEKTDPVKLVYFAKALAIVSFAKDNLAEESLQWIFELESQIFMELGDEDRIDRNLGILRSTYRTANGYYLCARILLRKGTELNKDHSDLALKQISEGLRYFPDDENCLSLRAKILKAKIMDSEATKDVNQDNLSVYFESLRDWNNKSKDDNAWLLYELGRTAFIMRYYKQSSEYFERLQSGAGIGHPLRTKLRDIILDRDGEAMDFNGTISYRGDRSKGFISCHSLRSLEYPLPFNWNFCNFMPSVGDNVQLHIKFNFRGPMAVDVRKVN